MLFEAAHGIVVPRGAVGRGGNGRSFEERFRQVFGKNETGRADDYRALHSIFQFANVAGPIVLREAGAGLRGNAFDVAIAALCITGGEVFRQKRNVFRVVPQSGKRERYYV